MELVNAIVDLASASSCHRVRVFPVREGNQCSVDFFVRPVAGCCIAGTVFAVRGGVSHAALLAKLLSRAVVLHPNVGQSYKAHHGSIPIDMPVLRKRCAD